MPRSRHRHSRYYGSSSRVRRGGRRGVFGGVIKSKEEVQDLNKRIVQHEQKEFELFEAEFDAELDEVGEDEK